MIAVDTSVVIAGLVSSHEHGGIARLVLADKPRLIAHVALEAYSVLTRLPAPVRFRPAQAQQVIAAAFREPVLGLPDDSYDDLLAVMAAGGVAGGAVYDALVGATAAAHGATLATFDRRAMATYNLVGATTRQLAVM